MGVIFEEGMALSSGDHNAPLIGYDSVLTPSACSATNQDAEHPATNLANPATNLRWQTDDETSPVPEGSTITFTVSSADPVDYIGIAAHNLGTAAAPLTVEKNAGAGYVSFFPQRTLTDDTPVIFRFTPQVLTGVRLTIGAGTTFKRIGVVYIGRLLVLPLNLWQGHTPLPHGRATKVVNGESESGQFLGRVVTQELVQSRMLLQHITPAIYRSDIDPFLDAAKDTPFFVAWRPGDYPAETGYAWLKNDPAPVNQAPSGLVQLELQMAGVVA